MIPAPSRMDEVWSAIGVLVVVLMVMYGSCSMAAWRYDECLAVGHSKPYCQAEYVGCFSGRGRR